MWRRTWWTLGLLSVVFTVCSVTDDWKIKVLKEVTVSRGEDAVLGCSLINLGQQLFSEDILVQWLARDPETSPFISCSISQQSTHQDLRDCLTPAGKYSLTEDLQRGNLSLRIRSAQFIELHVGQPKILSLTVEETGTSQNASRWLKCEAEGNSRPKIVWLTASRMKSEKKATESSPDQYRVISSVPYPEDGEELTCRAENELGHVERTHLTNHTPLIPLAVCGACLLLLLLLSAGVTVYCRRKKASEVTAVEAAIYEKAGGEGVQGRQLPTSSSRNSESLIYTAITAPGSASSPSVNFQKHHEAGIVYSGVNLNPQGHAH
ncbi:uncharacterized protein LOC107989421 [Cynoglossus semilaevis]|uniref:uncharacterized protein LOC107989421 n=1 Tax=Cynoglossus semilaevis TaxID=244447 RepID=UPI000D629FE0|nr:uncharacterized protein LOC107989421 [Cynoglossus semilaevis]